MHSSLPDEITVKLNKSSKSSKKGSKEKEYKVKLNKYSIDSIHSMINFIIKDLELFVGDEEFNETKAKLYSCEGVELTDGDLYFLNNKEVIYLDLKGADFNYNQILDQYEIIQKIGQGGFGSVYKVKHKLTK